MKWFNRSILYLKRSLKKMILIFLVIFILGNIMCIVSSIQTTSLTISNIIKQKVGSVVIYKDTRFNNMNYEITCDDDLNQLYKYEQTLIKIMNHQSVQYANYSYMTELEDKTGNLHYGYGISSSPMVDVLENKLSIVEGREFNKDEIESGKYVVLVEKGSQFNGEEIKLYDEIEMRIQNDVLHCSEMNGCELGVEYGNDYTLKVIGLFEKKDKVFDNQNKDYQDISNRWYLPNKTILEIFENKKSISNYDSLISYFNLAIDEPFIRLNNIHELNPYLDDIEAFLLNEKDLQGNNYDVLYTSNDEYNNIFKSVRFLPIIGYALLIISVIVFSLLLCVLIITLLKERFYEIGILLALGEKKYKIIIQLFLELLLVGIISISSSLVSGRILGNVTVKSIVENNVAQEYELDNIDKNQYEHIVVIYYLSGFILILSMIYPTIIIVKFNPKNILLMQ